MSGDEDEREQLRELTRAAHEAAGDLRRAIREAGAVQSRLVDETGQLIGKLAETTVRAMIQERLDAELDRFTDQTQAAIATTERALEARLVRMLGALVGMPPSVDTLDKFTAEIDDRLASPQGKAAVNTLRVVFPGARR